MLTALANLGTAFGLSGSAGLNAYIPLLMFAVAARYGFVELSEPYDLITHDISILLLSIFLVIEMFVDKVPAIDSINDMIQTFLRPAAGAFLFAVNANMITDAHPVLAIAAGIVLAGGVHAVKGVTRPVVTATTAGTGNWLVSLLEDITAFFASLMALILPLLLMIIFLPLMAWGSFKLFRRWQTKDDKLVFK
jgi:hypothetical protein